MPAADSLRKYYTERSQCTILHSGSGKSTLLNCIGGLDIMNSVSITVDGKEIFGLLFVTAEQYDAICESGTQNAEEYTYAYRLGNTTDDTLKEKIKAIKIEPELIENGIRDLKDGADALFAQYLAQANQTLAKQHIELTDENYADTLESVIAATHSEELAALKTSLDERHDRPCRIGYFAD